MSERYRIAVYANEYKEHGVFPRHIGVVDIIGAISIDAILKHLGYFPTYEFDEKVYEKDDDPFFTIYPEDVIIKVLKDPNEELFGGTK